MDVPQISIIVPVYCSQQYLGRCIDSILSQTHTNWELILVNDGSKDSSGKICDFYASKDSRIRVIHKDNGGVSSARNVGLDKATGKWIAFVDSDDYVEINYLKNFCDSIKTGIDIVAQGFCIHDNSTRTITDCCFNEFTMADKIGIVRFFEESDTVHNGLIWHRLFKKDVIDRNLIRFDETINYAEDALFFLSFLSYSSTMAFSSKVGYHYFLYESNSLTKQGDNIEYPKKILTLKKIKEILDSLAHNSYDQRIVNQYIWRLVDGWFISNMYNSHPEWEDECFMSLRSFLSDYEGCDYSGMPLYRRLYSIILRCAPRAVIHYLLKIPNRLKRYRI